MIQSEVQSWLGVSVSFFPIFLLRWQLAYISLSVQPSLVKNGLAFGVSISDEFPLVSYNAMSFSDPDLYATHPSPRYWLLWPGVMIMLLYSFADVVLTMVPLLRGNENFR